MKYRKLDFYKKSDNSGRKFNTAHTEVFLFSIEKSDG